MSTRRSVLTFCAACCALGSLLVFGAVSALAATPQVEEEFLTHVSSSSAALNATIDPQAAAGAEYRFEYATGAGAFQPVPSGEGPLGEGSGGVHVKAELEGLTPDTAYRFQVSVTYTGAVEPAVGEAKTFTTKSSGAAPTLVDGRQWEMVSPPNKHGSGIEAMNNYAGGVLQAAENGDGITYWASGPIVNNPEGNVGPEHSQVLSIRDAPGVWSSQDVVAPHKGSAEIPEGSGFEYKMFSSDLSSAVLEPLGETLLPAPNKNGEPEKTIYMRDDLNNAYQALVNENNIVSSARLGEIFGDRPIKFKGASPDLKHVLFGSVEPLTVVEPGVEPAAVPGDQNIYEWNGEPGQEGTVSLVSRLPHGETSSESANLPGDEKHEVGRDVLSTDGARVVWTGGPTNENLYVTDMEKGETRLVAAATRQGEPMFEAANADGTQIFFIDDEKLVPGADKSNVGIGDLYVFEVPRSKPLSEGTLQDLTVDTHEIGGQKENGLVLGRMIGYGTERTGTTESTSIYFVDNGVLSENKGAESQGAVAGGQNLYVERLVGGVWQEPDFITSLPLAEANTWGAIGSEGLQYQMSFFTRMTSGVSGSGRYLAFMSAEPLTGFDNHDAVGGVRDQEVFLYDAATDKLVCASCNKFGVRPHGLGGGAGSVSHWYANINPGIAQYEPRFLSSSGRLFFDSPDMLVPGASNGLQNVYEYEPEGVGSCSPEVHSQDVVFREENGVKGCVGLISSGTSNEESTFLDASGKGPGGEEGEDVFFLTKSQLSSQDIDSANDVYDAHECSTVALCASGSGNVPPACIDADSCRVAPTPQPSIFGAPSSATFTGAGNPIPQITRTPVKPKGLTRAQRLARALAACKHRAKRTRAECVVRARKEFGPVRATRSGMDGRGK